MSFPVTLPPWRTILAGSIAIQVVLVALHLTGQATGVTLFDLPSEGNVPTWFSSAQFLLAGLACFVASRQEGATRNAWVALALVMTAFSADEIAGFHERFETHQGVDTAILVIEPILGLIVIAIVWSVLRDLRREAVRLLAGAMLAIVLAQGISVAAEKLEPEGTALDALAIFEEVFEMLTGTLVLGAALVTLDPRGRPARPGAR
jgi:hypothetical protein